MKILSKVTAVKNKLSDVYDPQEVIQEKSNLCKTLFLTTIRDGMGLTERYYRKQCQKNRQLNTLLRQNSYGRQGGF